MADPFIPRPQPRNCGDYSTFGAPSFRFDYAVKGLTLDRNYARSG